ncbi:MAG: hypothetical protein AAB731_03060, partial [Patescibacteria group bacterium]
MRFPSFNAESIPTPEDVIERPKISKKPETVEVIKGESTRPYEASPVIKYEISHTHTVYEKPIGPDTKTCLIGDGQGMDTLEFLKIGVKPENVSSVNYEQKEVQKANDKNLVGTGVEMKQGDATDSESLKRAGIELSSQDIVTLMHVLEVPDIKNEAEARLIKNLVDILKSDGELLVSQYKQKLT